jgi:hypothetical protein
MLIELIESLVMVILSMLLCQRAWAEIQEQAKSTITVTADRNTTTSIRRDRHES